MRFLIQLGILAVVALALFLFLALMFAWRDGEILDVAIAALVLLPALYVVRLLWKADNRQARDDATRRLQAEEIQTRDGDLLVGNSWLGYAGVFLVLALALPGTLMLFSSETFPGGVLFCVVLWPFPILYLLLWAKQLGRSRLRLDSRGIDHFIFGLIPWQDIFGLVLQTKEFKEKVQYFLALGVNNPDQYHARVPRLVRMMSTIGVLPKQHATYLQISLHAINLDPHTVHAAALRFRNAVQPPLENWRPGMTPAERALEREEKELMDRVKARTDHFVRIAKGNLDQDTARTVLAEMLRGEAESKSDMQRLDEIGKQRDEIYRTWSSQFKDRIFKYVAIAVLIATAFLIVKILQQ